MINNNSINSRDTLPAWLSKLTMGMLTLLIFSTFLLSSLPYGNFLNKIITVICVAVVCLIAIRLGMWFSAEMVILLTWTLYALAISMFASEPYVALNKGATMFQIAVLFILVSNLMLWQGDLRFFMWTFVAATLAAYLINFTPLSGLQFGTREIGTVSGRVAGTLVNSNKFGVVALQAEVFVAYLWCTAIKSKEKILIALVFFVLGLAIMQCGSRTAGLGFFVLIVLIGWAFQSYNLIKYRMRLIAFSVGLIMIITAGIMVISKNPHILERWTTAIDVAESGDLSEEVSGNSLKIRAALARLAWNLWLEHPQGIGLDNFRIWSPGGGYAHSNYMELLACTGLIGLVIFYSIYFVLFLKVYRIPPEFLGGVAARRLVLSFLLVLCLTDITNVNYYSKHTWLAISILVVTVTLAKRKVSQEK